MKKQILVLAAFSFMQMAQAQTSPKPVTPAAKAVTTVKPVTPVKEVVVKPMKINCLMKIYSQIILKCKM